MRIGQIPLLVKQRMEHAEPITQDHQQDNAFKMVQMVFGVQMFLILAHVNIFFLDRKKRKRRRKERREKKIIINFLILI